MTTIQNLVGGEVAMTEEIMMKISEWNEMLTGQASWCSNSDYITSLRIEHGICREFADVVLNEMEVSVSNEKLNTLLQACIEDLNENLQDGLGLGSFIIKPLGKDKVEYITADKFIPIHFDDTGKPDDCMFIQVKRQGTSQYYIRTERHDIRDGNLRIRNKAYKSFSQNTIGMEIPLSFVEEWKNFPENITYKGMTQMDFGYFRTPLKNKIDGSPCGISIFESAIEQIKKADIQGARIDWEFESGERAIHVDERALNTSIKGKKFLERLNKRLYRGFKLDAGKDTELFKEFSPELREEGFINGLEKYYRQIEFAVGLSYGDLSDAQYVEKTATEIKASKSRKYNRVTAIQDKLKVCLEDLVAGLAFYNGLYTSGYEFQCHFNDSILTDEEAERQQDRQDVSMGVMSLTEYRAKWYGETEEEAEKKLPEVNGVME
ncbi:MAG: phage capsid protein [Blautia hansenii]|uniref:Phage portal protein, SPP1 Gp6-like n=1 Tax=Blautia hansenii TaxID=1322 RepID=A0A6N2UPF7_BLAHA